MFIKLVKHNGILWLYDSNFTERIGLPCDGTKSIIERYHKHDLSALQALKYWIYDDDGWLGLSRLERLIKVTRNLDFYPELKFRDRYYPCLVNHLKKLEFLNK